MLLLGKGQTSGARPKSFEGDTLVEGNSYYSEVELSLDLAKTDKRAWPQDMKVKSLQVKLPSEPPESTGVATRVVFTKHPFEEYFCDLPAQVTEGEITKVHGLSKFSSHLTPDIDENKPRRHKLEDPKTEVLTLNER
jgi:hypothetical protein